MYTEDDLYPLSALQHYAFCPRQCALIHVEQQWAENRLTAEGRILHDRVHERRGEQRSGILACRGLRIRSFSLGLTGQADMVEFHGVPRDRGITLPGRKGHWSPIPIEYKHGKVKKNNCDAVQLCAQAICLEEMLGLTIGHGFLFYGKNKRRHDVHFDQRLREETCGTAVKVHELLAESTIPPAVHDSRCRLCSLREICQPELLPTGKYLSRQVRTHLQNREGEA